MASEPETTRADPHTVEMPAPTVWPVVLGLGIALVALGVATSLAFAVLGVVLFMTGLGGWIGELFVGRGHVEEPVGEPGQRPAPIAGVTGMVEQMDPSMPGYRFQLPEKIHPISAGLKGGLVGGLLMPLPALAWSLLSRHGPFYPLNLLVGMVLPVVGDMTVVELEKFYFGLFVIGIVIHVVMSAIIGLIYGVLLPMMPRMPGGPIIFGGVLLPLLWTGVCYGLMGVVNPVLQLRVNWPWFVISQFLFGVAAAIVVARSETVPVPPVGPGMPSPPSGPSSVGSEVNP
jgi:hypothetical protein